MKSKILRRMALNAHKTAPATPSLSPFLRPLFLSTIQHPNPEKKRWQHNYVDNHDNDNNMKKQQRLWLMERVTRKLVTRQQLSSCCRHNCCCCWCRCCCRRWCWCCCFWWSRSYWYCRQSSCLQGQRTALRQMSSCPPTGRRLHRRTRRASRSAPLWTTCERKPLLPQIGSWTVIVGSSMRLLSLLSSSLHRAWDSFVVATNAAVVTTILNATAITNNNTTTAMTTRVCNNQQSTGMRHWQQQRWQRQSWQQRWWWQRWQWQRQRQQWWRQQRQRQQWHNGDDKTQWHRQQ